MTNLDEICPDIKSNDPIEKAMAMCLESKSKNPIEMMKIMMEYPGVPFHGPVHHVLVPFAVLTAYKNSGGELDLPAALNMAYKRGSIIPAAVCGHWGSCGAALGCGIAFSIITKDGPLAGEIWSKDQIMVSNCLSSIAQYGGPRCCKRDTYLAIPVAAKFFEDYLGVKIEIPEKITCFVSEKNSVCLKEVCPFNPGHKG